MGTVTMMQGDAFPVLIELTQSGTVITADMVDDVEICIGNTIRRTAASGGVLYDSSRKKWYVYLTQEETLSVKPGQYNVVARVKYKDQPPSVKGVVIGRISVREALSKEVI